MVALSVVNIRTNYKIVLSRMARPGLAQEAHVSTLLESPSWGGTLTLSAHYPDAFNPMFFFM